MKANFYKITLIFLLFALSSTVFSQSILMVTQLNSETGEIPTQDSALVVFLEDYAGWIIDAVDMDAYSGGTDPDYTKSGAYSSYDAIYISDAVGSSTITPFEAAGFPIPCVTNEGYAVRSNRWKWIEEGLDDELFIQLSGDQRNKETYKLIIHDEDHFISNLYPADYELLWTSYPDSMADGVGVTGFKLDDCIEGAISLGHFGSDSIAEFPSFWAIPENSTVFHSSVNITSNIVVIGTVVKAVGIYATEEYNKLLYWSFKWVMGDETVSVKSNTQNNDLSVWPNPTIGNVNFSFTLSASGNARINIYNIAGKLIESFDSDYLSAGKNTIKLDFLDMAEGFYIYEIITGNDFINGKIIKN